VQAEPVSAGVDEATTISIFFFSAGDLLHRKRYRRQREVGDHVDALGVVPAARDGGGEIWLVLVISVDQLDLLAKHAAAKILNRHFAASTDPLPPKSAWTRIDR
jgi:hypothetical protein